MDIGETIRNPWVIGGGVVVGVILLTLNRGGGGGAVAATHDTSGLYAYAIATGAQQVQKETSLAQVTAADHANFRSLLVNSMGAMMNYNVSMETLHDGVVKANIASRTALALDQYDNANRVAVTSLTTRASVDMTKLNADSAVTIANTNAQAQQRIAQTQATASIIGNVIGFVGHLFGL